MVRTTTQRHDRAENAWSAVDALRAVGLGDDTVALVVLASEMSSQCRSNRPPVDGARSVLASIPGLGPGVVTGWLVSELPDEEGLDAESWLRHLLKEACPGENHIRMMVATLRAGGGLVSVRSSDRIESEPTVNDILKGRSP